MQASDQPNQPISPVFRIVASLPFPIRLTGGPYSVGGEAGKVDLWFETVRQERPDQRLQVDRLDADFEVDRHGWASYTRVTCEARTDGSNHPIYVMLDRLNQLLQHLRDTAGLFWLHKLEDVDLLAVTVESGDQVSAIHSWGRTSGIGSQVRGLADSANLVLKDRLEHQEEVLSWRLLYLDAQDALSLGKYEQAVLLGWSALEVACRTETPRLARSAGLTPADLEERLTGKRPKIAPFSLEEVIEHSPVVLRLVRVCCELAGSGYDPGSLTQSAKEANHFRNVVIHQGVPISQSQAHRVLEAAGFILHTLRLPTSRKAEPFNVQSWLERFGSTSLNFPSLLGLNNGRIVVFRAREESQPDPINYWFQLERIDNVHIVRLRDDISEAAAATLSVVTNDSYFYRQGRVAYMGIDSSARSLYIPGLLDQIAGTVTQSVHWAHAALVRKQDSLAIEEACDYAVDSIWRGFMRLNHTIPLDSRFLPICTRIASYLVHAPQSSYQQFRMKMSADHKLLSDGVREVFGIMKTLDADDPHSICSVLRQLHGRSDLQGNLFWLDTLVVRCPSEGKEYGTREGPLSSFR